MNQPEPTLLPGLRRPDRGHASTFREREMHNSSRGSNLNSRFRETILHDNSFGEVRGFGGELPFCYGEPLVLRKQEDLGVSIQEKEKGSICIEFGATVGDGEYETIPCKVKTGHRLCVPCRDTISYFLKYLTRAQKNKESPTFKGKNSHPLMDMDRNVLLHSSLFYLYASAHIDKTLCYFCTQLWETIEHLFPNLRANAYDNYRIEACWRLRPEEETIGEPKIWFIMVNSAVEKEGYYNWQPLYRLSLWPAETHGKYFDKRANAVSVIPIRGPWDDCADNGSNDGLPSRQLALAWFQRCKANEDGQHDLCNRQDGGFLPTRLIDVPHALEHGKVRLVCWRDTPGRFTDSASKLYATLSHCWGKWGSENNPNLLSTNIEDRVSTGLDFDSLPGTFKDAIKIASWFGWDWLWIDSLCIIQDSKSDWASEAATMDKVYHNSQINISADLGNDSRSGCFVQPGDLIDYPLTIGLEGREDEWFLTGDKEFRWMKFAPSFSRAWIHRERQLSRRILHCTTEEFVWECCGLGNSGFASQAMPGGAPFDSIFNKEIKFQVQWQQALESAPQEAELPDAGQSQDAQAAETMNMQVQQPEIVEEEVITEEAAENQVFDDQKLIDQEQAMHLDKMYGLWNTTCQDLSNKSVTFATDMPIILSSLAREFQEMIPDDEYICGHWRSTLPESLNWFTRNPKKAGLPYVAPSWSWLSIARPVQLPIRSYYKHNIPVAEVLDIERDYATDDKYGQVTKGELTMRGYVRRLHFYFLGNGHFIISVIEQNEFDEEERIRVIGPDWNPIDGLTCQMTTDKQLSLEGQEWECTALFTVINENGQDVSSCERELSCVLLEEVGHETPEVVDVPPMYHQLLTHLNGTNGPPPTVYTTTLEEAMKDTDEEQKNNEEEKFEESNGHNKQSDEEATPGPGLAGEENNQKNLSDNVLDEEADNSKSKAGKPGVDETEAQKSVKDDDEEADAKEQPKRYRKVGTLNNLCDEYSFKLRYTVISYEDEEVKGKYRSGFVNNPDNYSGPTITHNLEKGEEEPPSSEISNDIWDNLAEFIARKRWAVLYPAQLDKRERYKKEGGEDDVREKVEPFKTTSGLGPAGTEEPVKEPVLTESTGAPETTLPLHPKKQTNEESSCNDKADLEETSDQLHDDTKVKTDSVERLPGPAPTEEDKSYEPSSGEDEEAATGDQTEEEERESVKTPLYVPPMVQIYMKIRTHPCGFEHLVTGHDNLVASVREFLAFRSVHPAHGKEMDVYDALYQFDRVLYDWMEAQEVCQWLVALDPEELIII